jgi:hypothetical protein
MGQPLILFFWLQSDPACKPHAHVKLEAGPGLFGAHKINPDGFLVCNLPALGTNQ